MLKLTIKDRSMIFLLKLKALFYPYWWSKSKYTRPNGWSRQDKRNNDLIERMIYKVIYQNKNLTMEKTGYDEYAMGPLIVRHNIEAPEYARMTIKLDYDGLTGSTMHNELGEFYIPSRWFELYTLRFLKRADRRPKRNPRASKDEIMNAFAEILIDYNNL